MLEKNCFKEEWTEEDYKWILSIVNDPNKKDNLKLQQTLEDHKNFKQKHNISNKILLNSC